MMKNKVLILSSLILAGLIEPCYASSSCKVLDKCPDNVVNYNDTSNMGCSPSFVCVQHYGRNVVFRVATCNSCGTDAKPVTETGLYGCDDELKYTYCHICNSNTCKSDTTYTNTTKAGYQVKATRQCNASKECVVTSKSYRCAKNYFGTPTNGESGCARCWEAVGAVTKAAGSTSATDCYIPKGNAFSDSTGSGEYAADCYYKD